MDVSFDALVPPGSFRTTFKTLKGVGPNLQFASTLGFKERVALQRASPAEYSK